MTHSHDTVPTRYVEAAGIRFAYRRFGKAGGMPLVFNQHFTGTMDYWDPAVTDGLAASREVILFNNAGIANSSGETPESIPEMGVNAIAFIRALGLETVDVLGFSIGGFVAQEIALQAPDLVRKLILVGTGTRGSDMAVSRSAQIFAGTATPRSMNRAHGPSAKPSANIWRPPRMPSITSNRSGSRCWWCRAATTPSFPASILMCFSKLCPTPN